MDTANIPRWRGFSGLLLHDGGTTFSRPVTVSDPARPRVVAPALTLGPGHAVHVAYYDLGNDARDYQGVEGPVWDATWSVVATTSIDSGRRFRPGVVVDDAIVPVERVMLIFTMSPPALVADRRLVCAAWTDARYGDADALARCSRDGGRRWESVRRLNDDKKGTGARQYLPRLGLAPNGRLDAVFLDRRRDPFDTLYETSYTYSTDGGRHFAANHRLSREFSNSKSGSQYAGVAAEGQYEFGSRLGLLSQDHAVVAAWPDTRTSSGRSQDIFSARAELAGGARPRWGPAAPGPVAGRRRHGRPRHQRRTGPDTPAPAPWRPRGELNMGHHRIAAVVPAAMLVLAGCASSPTGVVRSPLPPPPQIVHVTITDHHYAFDAGIHPGRTIFVAHKGAGRRPAPRAQRSLAATSGNVTAA